MGNPHALYVNCDGAMDYARGNPGGIGFVFTFPDSLNLDPIEVSHGTYLKGNIEQLEIEALIQAMKEAQRVFNKHREALQSVNTIIFVTDRFGLNDQEKTSPYRIRDWRRNGWKNREGKPIKNHKLLDELDKTRLKLSASTRSRVKIEWQRRKFNKRADKLAKAGKKVGLPNYKLQKKGEKIGRRKYDGSELDYKQLREGDEHHINVFRKDPVQDQWEIWVEICAGRFTGNKFKVYADDSLAGKLKRGNEYVVRLKRVFTFHVTIFRTVKRPRKSEAVTSGQDSPGQTPLM